MTDPAFLELAREYFANHVPFQRFLGFEVAPIEHGLTRIELPFRPEFVGDTERPALHGGVVMTIIDACGGLAVWSRSDPQVRPSTIDVRVDFLRPGRTERLIAEARVVRIGNRVGVAEIRAFHAGNQEEPIATGIGVYSLYRPRSEKGED